MEAQGHILIRRKAKNGIDGTNGEPGKNGLQGCILRQSEWAKGIEYRNDEALTSGTRYLDIAIVTTGANTFNAYKCLKTHTSSDSIPVTNTTYWQKFNSLVPVYTPLIMAQNAILRFMQGNQLLIMKSDNTTVAAGLVGGDYPLWIGAATPTDAPYKVSIAGKLYATGAVISGDSTFEGTLKGVSGSFRRLNCVNAAGDAVGGIRFGSDGKMWFDGDMYHQGYNYTEKRSFRFYTSDLWCRGEFGHSKMTKMEYYGYDTGEVYFHVYGVGNAGVRHVYPVDNGQPVDCIILSGNTNYIACVCDASAQKMIVLINNSSYTKRISLNYASQAKTEISPWSFKIFVTGVMQSGVNNLFAMG